MIVTIQKQEILSKMPQALSSMQMQPEPLDIQPSSNQEDIFPENCGCPEPSTMNSLDYHNNDEIEFVNEEISSSGY